jgi:hypothetical protein
LLITKEGCQLLTQSINLPGPQSSHRKKRSAEPPAILIQESLGSHSVIVGQPDGGPSTCRSLIPSGEKKESRRRKEKGSFKYMARVQSLR